MMGWNDEVSLRQLQILLVGLQTSSTGFAISLAVSSNVAIGTTVLALSLRAICSNMAWFTTSAAGSGGTILRIVVSRSVSDFSRAMVKITLLDTYCWQWRHVTSVTSLLLLMRSLKTHKQLTWLLRTVSGYVTFRVTSLALNIVDVSLCLRVYADVRLVAHPRE